MKYIRITFAGFGLIVFCATFTTCISQARAQNINRTIQLPVIRYHSIRTAVSVPDGGTMNLSGGSVSGFGQSQYGRMPSTAMRGRNHAGSAQVSAHVLRLREMETGLMHRQQLGGAETGGVDVNGDAAVQQKADFMSRNTTRN